VIDLRTETRIWIAAGVTDMRRGFDGLSAQVQTVLNAQPCSGHVFVFRGRRGDQVKLLWFDGDGLCLFSKRLERGRFVWPNGIRGSGFLYFSPNISPKATEQRRSLLRRLRRASCSELPKAHRCRFACSGSWWPSS